MSLRRRGRVAAEAPPVTSSSWDEAATTSGRELLPESLLNRVAAGGLSGTPARRRAWPLLMGSTHGPSSSAMLQLLLERLDTLLESSMQLTDWYEAKVMRRVL